ncbi:unnamed protein product [Lasius platythorax]|uniref:Uncharacterized protein n=1 Tax=Lasius platythorax TaxID=488582 RepID=A0AAV2MZT8_9HYME
MCSDLGLRLKISKRSNERSLGLRDAAATCGATRARRTCADGGDTGLANGRVEGILDASTIKRPTREEAWSFLDKLLYGKDPVSRAKSNTRYAINAKTKRSVAGENDCATIRYDTENG